MGNSYNRRWQKDWRSTAPIRYKTIKITSLEILALNGTPKELVPAPGAGRAIEFVSAVLHLDYDTATYTGNGTLEIRTVTGEIVLSTVLGNEFLHSDGADKIGTIAPISGSLVFNDAIELYELTGECTVGDSPITVVVGYRVHSFIAN